MYLCHMYVGTHGSRKRVCVQSGFTIDCEPPHTGAELCRRSTHHNHLVWKDWHYQYFIKITHSLLLWFKLAW